MGLQQLLGYRVRPANAAQRAVQRVAATRVGAWCAARATRPLDHLLLRVSHGRITVATVTAGIPVLTVTTTGRRSGLPRTTPLLGVPTGDDLAVIGTNFGQEHEPAWVANLRADPRAVVEYHGRRVPIVARDAEPAARDEILRVAARIYPGYDRYRARITSREIPVLVLTPAVSG
jgi:deazaflavin-dependent oxidoreductase (nitroreductase family)